MAGGLMQLVAVGAQDAYLTGNPKVTFFQAAYKRYTNFAMETIEQTVNGSAGNSGRISVTIARNGDLIGEMYMELQLIAGNATLIPNALAGYNDTCWVAERAISAVELTVGGQRIDKHYQRWWRLYAELYLDTDKKAKYGKMTSSPIGSSGTSSETQVFLPLLFFFNRNPGLFLPLIALQYHEVRLDFDLSDEFNTYFNTSYIKVWGNYVYLDTEERKRFAQKPHDYLIEQVQHTGTDSLQDAGTKQVRLSYNHPIKELIWCCTKSTQHSRAYLWNFTTGVNTSNAVVLTCADNIAVGAKSATTGLVVPGLYGAPMYDITNSEQNWVEEGIRTGNYNSIVPSVGPLKTFKLILNGQDRFKEQSGKYFNQVQPFLYHSGTPYPGIYSYSFALKPEDHQPTGTCNFSRIDNAQVEVVLKDTNGAIDTLDMYAVGYNIFKIQSGMGGLGFAS